ncbi:MAG TPA: GntG family PLP-dependent aldolase [Polyangium sp.]|nr:GntG family PLP-dependent aldolase [Polyangium sp.]
MIDLRSDTVTKPTPAMREAMARADVGDDVYGEDPTANELQRRVAKLTGKEAALFVTSGTMSNQIALLCHTQRGDEVLIGEGAHVAFYESGAAPAWSGVQFEVVGRGGLFTASELVSSIKPPEYYNPRARVVALENTHNRAGGRIFPQKDILEIAIQARAHGLSLHLDGARIWNASIATGLSVAELCAPFDTVSVCFSKGLGAPVGSALVSNKETILRARRFRKMLGGGGRQIGILAAGAAYALEHHRERLVEDHLAAKEIASAVRTIAGVFVPDVETNIVMIDVPVAAEQVTRRARERGVLVSAFGPRRIRVVTHMDLPAERVSEAATVLVDSIRDAIANADSGSAT